MTETPREAIDAALAAARRDGRTHWVAHVVPDHPDADALARLAPGAEEAFCYEVPAAGLAVAARGAAASIEAEGPERFARAERALGAAAARVWTADESGAAARGVGPVWVGGFAFADRTPADGVWRGFPAARWWLPRELWMRRGEARWRVRVADVAPGADAARVARDLCGPGSACAAPRDVAPGAGAGRTALEPARSAAAHAALVARALGAIARGELEKVVVARALDVERAAPFDPLALLRALRAAHPECASFAVARAGAWLVGATPERLLRRAGRRVEATALAGSAPRGRSPAEDARLRRELRESKKEQSEHAVAVRALRAALEAHGAALRVPEAPGVLALAGVQHLCTALRGVLPADAPGLLGLAGGAHPSAAVAGAPRDAAQAWLARHERLERGWYAGLVGWVTPEGDGELSAALRCALLRGGRARLFAGGGIVAGSRPEAELAETRLKWNALLPALLEL